MNAIKIFLLYLLASSFAVATYASAPSVKPVPLSHYGQLPSVAFMALSPSGKQLATVATIKKKRLLVIGEPGGKVSRMLGLDNHKVNGIHWAGENFVIIKVSSTHNLGMYYGYKHELSNFAVLNVRTGEIDLPLDSNKVLGAAFGFYEPLTIKGRWHQCIGTLPMDKSIHSNTSWIADFDVQLSCADLESGRLKRIATGRKNGKNWLIGPGAEVLAYDVYDRDKQRWQLRLGESATNLFSSKDPFGSNQLLGQGRRKGTVLFVLTAPDGGAHYFESELKKGGATTELFKDKLPPSAWVFDRQTGLLSGVVHRGDFPNLEMFDDKAEAVVRGVRKAFPNKYVRFISWSDDLRKLIVHTDSSEDSGTYWFVNVDTGSAVDVGWDYPSIRSAQVGQFKMIEYKAADGLTISAVLTLPPAKPARKLPLVVLPHGGPQSRDYPRFNWEAQAYASRGYAVLQPNFRGSSGYGLKFRDAGFGQWGRKMQTDLSDGVAALAERGIVDASRVCIVGGSYGGYAALAGVTVQQGIYRCAVSFAGVTDPKYLIREARQDRQRDAERYWKKYLGARGLRDDMLEEISPYHLAGQADAPILLIHGKDDTVVPVYESKKMAKRLKSKKKKVKYIELRGEDHDLSFEPTRKKMLEASVKFVMKHNPP